MLTVPALPRVPRVSLFLWLLLLFVLVMVVLLVVAALLLPLYLSSLMLVLLPVLLMVKITDVTMTVMMDGADGDDVVFQAQIEDGHGMAEHVSRSVRRLDAIQMRVQRALALVEDVINLRGCAEVGRREGRGGGGGGCFCV